MSLFHLMGLLSEISHNTWIRTIAINAEQKLRFVFWQKEQMDAYKYRNDDISLIKQKKIKCYISLLYKGSFFVKDVQYHI